MARAATLCACLLVGCGVDTSGLGDLGGIAGDDAASSSDASGADGGAQSDAPHGDSGVEDCLNGADDDGDGLVDCADPACAADYECTPAPQSGWTGFEYLARSAFANAPAPPACAGGSTATRMFDTAIEAPASCSACTCSKPTGGACNPPSISCWLGDANCSNATPKDETSKFNGGPCIGFYATQTTTSCMVTAPAAAQPGACTASASSPTLPPPWAGVDDVCTETRMGGGCAIGKVCARKPEGAFASAGACMRQDGDAACPPDRPVRHALFQSYTDSRGCGACACGAPSATCNGGSYQIYGCDTQCNGNNHCYQQPNPAPLSYGSGCHDVSNFVGQQDWSESPAIPLLLPGACVPSGGAPNGSVARGGAVTICCAP